MSPDLHQQLQVADAYIGEKISRVLVAESLGFLEAIALETGSGHLVFRVDADFDSILVSSTAAIDAAFSAVPNSHMLHRLIGEELSWTWLWVNNRGYQDGFAVAVGRTPYPCIAGVVGSASIDLFDLGQVKPFRA
jgi:hypothetical protein